MTKFGSAFKAARKAGKKEFTYEGKKYHTRTKEEDAAPKPAKRSVKDKVRVPKGPQGPHTKGGNAGNKTKPTKAVELKGKVKDLPSKKREAAANAASSKVKADAAGEKMRKKGMDSYKNAQYAKRTRY